MTTEEEIIREFYNIKNKPVTFLCRGSQSFHVGARVICYAILSRNVRVVLKIFLFLIVSLLFIYGCNSNPVDSEFENRFSIYLAKSIENNSPGIKSLAELELENKPFLSAQSIESYEWINHKITYSVTLKIKSK